MQLTYFKRPPKKTVGFLGERTDTPMAVYDPKLQAVTLGIEKRKWRELLYFSFDSTFVYRKLNVLAKILYFATV